MQEEHEWDFEITPCKISYCLIDPQLLPCAPACGHKSQVFAVYLHPAFAAPKIEGAFEIYSNMFGGALRK